MKILFAASEVFPLNKTGGLGDVIQSLPHMLAQESNDVRLILPAYRLILKKVRILRIVGWINITVGNYTYHTRILETYYTNLYIPLLLVDIPDLFDRSGHPYLNPEGNDWSDNAERFTIFSRIIVNLITRRKKLLKGWKPDIIHIHDWQTGLVPAFLSLYKKEEKVPATVFTIHNLSYGGLFPYSEFLRLKLPPEWWSTEKVEFHGKFSMLKAGIIFSDRITTVSPTYAKEILTPEFGHGFDGLLSSVKNKLSGILNGIDETVWNPRTDSFLIARYASGWKYMTSKRANKAALFNSLGHTFNDKVLDKPLLGFIGRLVDQKGIDLILDIIPKILEQSEANFVIVGSGQQYYERALRELATNYSTRILLYIGYSEKLAHRVEAGSDMFLMPSKFEPCGLNQLYSLRYGTPPIVRKVGGLADTVIDATSEHITSKIATGFVFEIPSADEFYKTIQRALLLYSNKEDWKKIISVGMAQEFSWRKSAKTYQDLYKRLIN